MFFHLAASASSNRTVRTPRVQNDVSRTWQIPCIPVLIGLLQLRIGVTHLYVLRAIDRRNDKKACVSDHTHKEARFIRPRFSELSPQIDTQQTHLKPRLTRGQLRYRYFQTIQHGREAPGHPRQLHCPGNRHQRQAPRRSFRHGRTRTVLPPHPVIHPPTKIRWHIY
jgi:hypothetical protein